MMINSILMIRMRARSTVQAVKMNRTKRTLSNSEWWSFRMKDHKKSTLIRLWMLERNKYLNKYKIILSKTILLLCLIWIKSTINLNLLLSTIHLHLTYLLTHNLFTWLSWIRTKLIYKITIILSLCSFSTQALSLHTRALLSNSFNRCQLQTLRNHKLLLAL